MEPCHGPNQRITSLCLSPYWLLSLVHHGHPPSTRPWHRQPPQCSAMIVSCLVNTWPRHQLSSPPVSPLSLVLSLEKLVRKELSTWDKKIQFPGALKEAIVAIQELMGTSYSNAKISKPGDLPKLGVPLCLTKLNNPLSVVPYLLFCRVEIMGRAQVYVKGDHKTKYV